MRTIANGIVTRFEMDGPGDAPVVMLSHSLAASLEMWDPQVKVLRERFRVLRYDTRGHGGSEIPPAPYTLEMLADDAAGLLSSLGIQKVHFVGLSMGGMIGQAMALRRPGILRSLVLADTMSRMPAEAGPNWDERIATARNRGMAALAEGTLARWFTEAFRNRSPEAIQEIRFQIRTTAPEGFVGCAEAIRRLNYAERLHEIRVPTLILVGGDDETTPVSASEFMHEAVPGSRLVIIPEAAHLSNVEQTDAFNEALVPFLTASQETAPEN